MKHAYLRDLCCAALAVAGVLGAVALSAAEPASRVSSITLDIPAQPLGDALTAFGQQSGLQVVIQTQLSEGFKAPAVIGTLTPEAALKRLLANTKLEYAFVDERTVAIRLAKNKSTMAGEGPAGQMRVAEGKDNEGKEAKSSATNVDSEGNQVIVRDSKERPKPFSTANLDLTRTEDDVLPYTVFTARDVELSGAASLQEFFQNKLPQNFSSEIPYEADGGASNSQATLTDTVNMRGWGAAQTVFLLNGIRMPAEYQGTLGDVSNATPNLRGIPLGFIERIEILTSAGSAIYGAGATGGVINIITRRDFRGGQIAVNYETPANAHAPKRNINLSYGLPIAGGFGLRMAAAYSDNQPLRAGHRTGVTIERWRQRAMAVEPSRLIPWVDDNPLFTNSALWGATPNIRAVSATGNLFSSLPGAPESNYTTVPDGYDGEGISSFQPGVWNTGLSDGSAGSSIFAKGSTLGVVNSNVTVSLGVDRDFGQDWRWSADYRYTQSKSEGQANGALIFSSSNPLSASPRVPAAAPGNPFGQELRMHLIDPNLQRPELAARPYNSTYEFSSTLQGGIAQWRGYIDLRYSHNRNRHTISRFIEPAGGWLDALLDGRYNPFVDPRRTSPAAPEFYEDYIVQRAGSSSATRNYQAGIKASGPLFRLPAGPLQLTVGAEWSRSDRYKITDFNRYEDNLTGAPRAPVSGAADYYAEPLTNIFVFGHHAGYFETSIPLVAPRFDLPLIRQWELFASGRASVETRSGFRNYDELPFEYVNKPYVYAFGFRHEVVEGLDLRISRSLGFIPPPMGEVGPADLPQLDACCGLYDPMRDDELITLTPLMYTMGTNPDLNPETTNSTNIGLILRPSWLEGLRLSVDYVENVRDDAIASVDVQTIINLEADIPGRVQRGAPDGDASGVGPITFVDARTINLRQIASKSVDMSLAYDRSNVFGGRLSVGLAASRNISFKVQFRSTTPPEEQVRNVNGSFSQQIEWNANGQVFWQGRRWGLGWNARYFDYILARTEDRLLQGSDRAPWKVNHDINLSYRVPAMPGGRGLQSVLSGISITGGVKNVFDRKPRFWAASADYGVAPYDSVMGRSVWLQMRRDFQ